MRLPRRHGRFQRFAGDRRGTIAVMSGLMFPVACVLAALAVDVGSIFAERRNMQGLTDLAAIAAVNSSTKATAAALETFRNNGVPDVREAGAKTPNPTIPEAKVEPGRYDGRDTVAAEKRFVAGGQPTNAFRVTLTRTATQYFSTGFLSPPTMQTTAIAHSAAEASFSVGSRLLALDGGVANAVLGSLLGANLSLSVMDYRALASAQVEIPAFLTALAGSRKIEAVSYSDLLKTDLPLKDFLTALGAVPGLEKAAAQPLRTMATAAATKGTVRLGDLFSLGSTLGKRPVGETGHGLVATAAAGDIANAAVALANRNRQVDVSLSANPLGILGATVHLAIGEPMQASPWVGTGEDGATVRTAQTRLLLELDVLGPGGTLGTSVRLPLYAEVAYAKAELAGIRCPVGSLQPSGVTLDATPGLADLRITDAAALADFKSGPALSPAALVKAPVVSASGSAHVALSDETATRLSFNTREIAAGEIKQVSSRNFVSAPVASLLGDLSLDVKVLGLGIGLPSVLGGTLKDALLKQAKPADLVLASVLDVLGIKLGQADVRVNGGVCNRAVLVQ